MSIYFVPTQIPIAKITLKSYFKNKKLGWNNKFFVFHLLVYFQFNTYSLLCGYFIGICFPFFFFWFVFVTYFCSCFFYLGWKFLWILLLFCFAFDTLVFDLNIIIRSFNLFMSTLSLFLQLIDKISSNMISLTDLNFLEIYPCKLFGDLIVNLYIVKMHDLKFWYPCICKITMTPTWHKKISD